MYRFKNTLMAARAAAAPRLWYRLIWIALLWPWVAVADQRTLSLEEAVDQALQETPQVAASAATLEAAQAVAPSAGHLPDPELVTGVDNLPVTTAERYSFTRDFMTMRKIGVLQSFPNGEKRRLQGELAQREIAVAQGDVRKTRFDTARAVAEAWIARAVAEESLVRLRSLRPDAQLEAAAGRAALASGRHAAAEALAAQSLVPELDERILALEQEIEIRRAELARWISTDAERPLAALPTDRDLGHSPESLLAAVPQHRLMWNLRARRRVPTGVRSSTTSSEDRIFPIWSRSNFILRCRCSQGTDRAP